MKRILIISPSLKVGGMEQHCVDLANELTISKTIDVTVYAPDEELRNNLKSEFIKCSIAKESNFLKYFSEYRKLKSIKFDVIYANELKLLLFACFLKLLTGSKLIVHVHSPISSWKISTLKKIVNLSANFLICTFLADKVIALTEEIKLERIAKEHLSSSKIVVIPNYIKDYSIVETKKLAIKHDKNKLQIGIFGRLTVEKGVDIFLSALAGIDKTLLEKVEVSIAGDGVEKEKLEDFVKIHNLPVRFLGFLAEDDKPSFYKWVDIMAYPTINEGFGLIFTESLVCGTKFLASDLPVFKEIVGETTQGVFVKTADNCQWAQVLTDLLKNNINLKSDIHLKARLLKKYSKDAFIKNFTLLFNGIN